ncbi:FAD-binding oxidoreductase [Dehalogenimonas sp. THU2]|uniref:ferredoxin--NADP reductase n=1 Tax=Dehalogenimonas sp. THU2 TaxID=3151121 RepID=UPI0032181AD1
MWQFETEFSEIIPRVPGVKSFRFPISPEKAPFEPGQYFFLTIKVNGSEVLHHFTISSCPTDTEYLEFTKRITEHDYSQALDAMKPGDWARIQGPSGSFTMPEGKQPLAFLTGGIGITPARSILRYACTKKLDRDIVLLYSNDRNDNIIFRDELDEISAAIPGIRIEHILSEPPQSWKGRTGLINKNLIIDAIPDYKERAFFISGPPRMVMSLQEQLSALRIPQDRVIRDSFTGYD